MATTITTSGREMRRLFLKAGWMLRRVHGIHHLLQDPVTGDMVTLIGRRLHPGTADRLLRRLGVRL
jgi:predicted RNA binding protein YcfA (HicA-like mRNA interferase family)